MLRCPACDDEMREVSARANPGTLIILDQCPKCGGIWCDKWELFPVDPEEADRLDPVDEALLQDLTKPAQKTLRCPRCQDKLQIFNDPLLPKEIRLQRCRRCEGIWLNRAQFSGYKSYQKKMRGEKMRGETIIHKLPEVYQDPKAWVVTGTRGIYAYPRGQDEADDITEKSLGGAFKMILQSLVRMVLGT